MIGRNRVERVACSAVEVILECSHEPTLGDGGVHERERDVDHRLEIGDRDVLVGRVDLGHPVREVDALEAALVEDVRVGGAAR